MFNLNASIGRRIGKTDVIHAYYRQGLTSKLPAEGHVGLWMKPHAAGHL